VLSPAKIHVYDSANKGLDIQVPSTPIAVGNLDFSVVDVERVLISKELSSTLNDSKKGPTDLVSGVYEGGLKLWEGSLDLVKYLNKHRDILRVEHKKKKRRGKGGGGGKKRGRRSTSSPLRCLELGECLSA